MNAAWGANCMSWIRTREDDRRRQQREHAAVDHREVRERIQDHDAATQHDQPAAAVEIREVPPQRYGEQRSDRVQHQEVEQGAAGETELLGAVHPGCR